MDVAIPLEESVAGGGECLGLAVAEPMVAQREELCENATCGPEVYLESVVGIAVEELGCTVVSCGNVRHASAGKSFAVLLLPFQRLVVIGELLCTAKVADLQCRLPSVVLSFSVHQDVVRLDVAVCDAFTVEVVKAFEELISHLLNSFEPRILLYVSACGRFFIDCGDTLPRVDVIFGEVARHEVADKVQVLVFLLARPLPKHEWKNHLAVRANYR